jgi:hypothetical protein
MAAASSVLMMALPSRDPGDGVMTLLALPSVDRATSMSTRLPALDHKVEERLRRSSYLAVRDISCLASDGVVTLRGRLPSYYLKQVAQELASGVAGVGHVVNRIEVFAPAGRARRAMTPGQPVCLSRATTASLVGRMLLPEHTTEERSSQRCWS